MSPRVRPETYQLALDQGLERVGRQDLSTLTALGAREIGEGRYELPVLDAAFVVDLPRGNVTRATADDGAAGAAPVRMVWQILAVHYLSASPPWPDSARWISFADIVEARGYEPVYRGRVLGRLCATAGRDRETFVRACERVGAERLDWGDEGFRFPVFPRLSAIIAWYRGDEDFPPNASFVYPDNIQSLLPIEDVIVLSEAVVSRLQGIAW